MTRSVYHVCLLLVVLAFTVYFGMTIIPALVVDKDIVGAFAAGFVNPYSSGYSADVICCWLLLMAWVVYEKMVYGQRHGWICVVLGLVPGVAVGFGLYLLLRDKRLEQESKEGNANESLPA